jgi:hypothetical protein
MKAPDMESEFPIGMRVKYSEEGLRVFAIKQQKHGTVLGYGRGGPDDTVCCVKVQWDGNKHGYPLHQSFVEPE